MENKKDYYLSQNGVSTFDYMIETEGKTAFSNYAFLNIIKYLSRNGKKENATDDLEKAKHYTSVLKEVDYKKYEQHSYLKHLLNDNFLQAQAEFNSVRDRIEKEKILKNGLSKGTN